MVPWERVDLLKDGLTDGARADDLNSVEFERDAMVDRRRVFEQKVLKKLYSSPPPEGKIPEALTTTFRAEKEQEKERSKSTGDSKEEDLSQKFPRKRKRRRKLNSSLLDHIKKNVPSVLQQPENIKNDILHTLHLDSAKSGAEALTKNKKRKLKKKRHKERLKAAGLAPRATAVEFTYQPAEGSSEEGVAESEESLRLLSS
ncbi:glutamate-rich protein 1 isoform X2 [Hemiscyllium ocellatum]|uniref:glutamate-rich protein 1 isoform X2 n=1 Tax=Hemiscyllium ocellatum TaxID=170820 RepID=UPI0029667EB7|nr:glutamate-rich protein 1 isoform X2 [Hemiscyllium ocellatum]